MGNDKRVKTSTTPETASITNYEDFVIVAQRTDARTVSVTVDALPAGRMVKWKKTSLPARSGEASRELSC